jgi:hypothetical protein
MPGNANAVGGVLPRAEPPGCAEDLSRRMVEVKHLVYDALPSGSQEGERKVKSQNALHHQSVERSDQK